MDLSRYGFDATRLAKREELIKSGVDPYPYSYDRTHTISEVLKEIALRGDDDSFTVSIAGRIWSRRDMGKSIFMDLRDESDQIQLYLKKDRLKDALWQQIRLMDLGDILCVHGSTFRTRSNELSIQVADFQILAKGVVPIPMGKETKEESFSRASDPEIRYRERYVHWLLDPVDRQRIVDRFRITSWIRRWMEDQGFIECTTPTIEFVYGGAEARPFETTIWALGQKKAFLRISPELYLKRYIVAGFPRVFTICQNFRNEGIDKSHNPEFTMIEWYETGTDYETQMKRFEDLIAHLCQSLHQKTRISYQGQELDFTPPWPRLTVLEALEKFAGIRADEMTVRDLSTVCQDRGIDVFEEGLSWGIAVVNLFESLCEEALVQPTFIIDHPVEISPLTKVKRGDPRLVERFEPYAAGMEIGNAYSELTDPVVQLERFMDQRDPGTDQEFENHPIDADFIKAVGCGMPPTGGVGLGIDRIVMLLTDAPSIRDIIPFPLVKPRGDQSSSGLDTKTVTGDSR